MSKRLKYLIFAPVIINPLNYLSTMKHYFSTLFVAIMAIMLLSSCMSKEERALDKLQNMSEQIQKNGDNMTSEDWEKLYDEYTALHDKMSNEDYNFTDEQMRELGKAERKLYNAFVKHSISDFGKATKDFFKKGNEFLKGLAGSDDDEEEE